jgi:hypothetical protein
MTANSRTRPLLCVLLVLSLCAPMIAIAAPVMDRDGATQFSIVSTPSSFVLLTRAGALHDHARLRPSAPSLFTLVTLQVGALSATRFVEAVERRIPRSLWEAGPRTGRSPPAIS